jgi:glycogen synthase
VRVLTVGNRYPPAGQGGYERMWQAAVEGLRARGHDVRVLTTPELRWYWHEHRWPRRRRLAAPWIERHDRRVFAAAAADADLVSLWSMGGLPMSLVRHRPAVAFVHDPWPDYGPIVDPLARRRAPDLPPAFWVSEFVRKGRPGEVLPSGYDERVFTPAPPRGDWPARPRLLLPGRLDARKGHRTALRAFGGGWAAAGAGDPRLERELRDAGVELLGALSPAALAAEYARADAVLFCVEWSEPWGLVPLEAMAVGRPVVATGTGGSAEFLRDGENCLLVAPGDAAALRAAVARLADPALRARLREGGLATAARHTLSRFVERVVAIHETYASAP